MLYNIYPPCWDVWNTFYIYGSNISGTEFCSWLLGSFEPIRGEWGKTTVPAQNILGFTSSFSCAISFNRRVSCLFSQLKLGRLKLQPGALGRAKSLPAPFQANSAAGGSKVFMYLWSNMLIFVVYTGLLHGNTSNLFFGGEFLFFFSSKATVQMRPQVIWLLHWSNQLLQCELETKQQADSWLMAAGYAISKHSVKIEYIFVSHCRPSAERTVFFCVERTELLAHQQLSAAICSCPESSKVWELTRPCSRE